MGWLKRSVERAAKGAIDDFMASDRLGEIVEERMYVVFDEELRPDARLTELGWLWALKLTFHKHGCTRPEAHALAMSTAAQYLADEKIAFGDPDYSWTRSAAEDVAEEYEFRHWEAA